MALTKDDILALDDLPRESVDVPEWGGTVYVRTLTGTERDAFEASVMAPRKGARMNTANIRARLGVLCIVDENGERLFSDRDAIELGKKSAPALDRIFTAAQRLNGLSAEDIEELVKNSDSDPSEDSTSA